MRGNSHRKTGLIWGKRIDGSVNIQKFRSSPKQNKTKLNKNNPQIRVTTWHALLTRIAHRKKERQTAISNCDEAALKYGLKIPQRADLKAVIWLSGSTPWASRTRVYTDICTPVFLAVLSIITKGWEGRHCQKRNREMEQDTSLAIKEWTEPMFSLGRNWSLCVQWKTLTTEYQLPSGSVYIILCGDQVPEDRKVAKGFRETQRELLTGLGTQLSDELLA